MQTWIEKRYFGSERYALVTTVPPQYSRIVEILLKAGLSHLDLEEDYSLNVEKIFVTLISRTPRVDIPFDLLEGLEGAIDDMVLKFSLNWTQSPIADSSLIKFEHEFEEHCPDLAVILRVLCELPVRPV